MRVLNREEILRNSFSQSARKARQAALDILQAGVEAAEPKKCVKCHLRRVGSVLTVEGRVFNLDRFERVIVVGGGKAGGPMAVALEEILGRRLTDGFVNVPRGTAKKFATDKIFLNEAGHPVPDDDGLRGSERMAELAEGSGTRDLVIALISGGGSALMPLPACDISLEDKQALNDLLLKSGASIHEMNVVRKHVSGIKGGQLASKAYPATLISLVLSDVPGDLLEVVASGPTVPDPSTYAEAVRVLKKYDAWSETPEKIRKHLLAGLRGKRAETPKPDDKMFLKTHNVIVGSNRTACYASAQKARRLGFNTLILSCCMEGEARHVGKALASVLIEVLNSGNPVREPAAIIVGGETTVKVTGEGLGGRNMELVLSAATKIGGIDGVSIASVGTDGIDGPTDAAGAIADGNTVPRASRKNLDVETSLASNDSYHFFEGIRDLILTGPTYTNVNDLSALVVV